jgi:hypothetical protein
MTTDLNWSMIVIEEYAYLYLPDESSCRSLHSLCLLIDGDLLMAHIMISTFMVDVYMLTPVLWVPLNFLDDVVIRLRRLLALALGSARWLTMSPLFFPWLWRQADHLASSSWWPWSTRARSD